MMIKPGSLVTLFMPVCYFAGQKRLLNRPSQAPRRGPHRPLPAASSYQVKKASERVLHPFALVSWPSYRSCISFPRSERRRDPSIQIAGNRADAPCWYKGDDHVPGTKPQPYEPPCSTFPTRVWSPSQPPSAGVCCVWTVAGSSGHRTCWAFQAEISKW